MRAEDGPVLAARDRHAARAIVPVDFADAPATRPVEFFRDLLGPPSQQYFSENTYGRLTWLDRKQLRGLTSLGTTEAELTPIERKGGLKAVVVLVSANVAYVIENRQRIGEDIELCKGVLVWVVDGSRQNVQGTP